eukprot:CAMPEP_0114652610 /NCGR_PEP_ID=MMETSP0191-20121206/9140_1 /TAXON_ID=126664 /ORGANISM="Sorites sp." /LENGTH=146 /DNA_ID=CAMNT_0001867245 /DNA_START=11 /DNA_END=448 /DNA_ORIENTATION=+
MEIQLASLNKNGGVTVKDVPAKEFIEAFSKYLKKGNKFKMPEWATYVKTACFKELGPLDQDWLYIRAASVAYQLYMRGKAGVGGLRRHYSEHQRRGTKREHTRKSAGKVIRYSLQQLSAIGLVGDLKYEESDHISGKMLTKKGFTD